ncbi:unnamed protein product [Lepeophtheirus salmonis]|uniref:(salmon louse) hypothetical protein n=1 Tax=Lepeophtheirus salmonis TaxID=72036 RepID=A0A7R8CTV4_LEPSM|nr:unnamed protein product [Lepeophtheirus salmonis]CAF2927838.1 unnamed protein product [Lepeophtheirus salmonis]
MNMFPLKSILCITLLLGVVLAQSKPKIGPDGRPLLNAPNITLCQNRISHGKLGGHHYFLSWREPWHTNLKTGTGSMLVAFVVKDDKIKSIWTSGRKCNFQGKGCDKPKFQPINVRGWFWSGAGNSRLPPTNKRNKNTYWSKTGKAKKPQPDNFEGLKAGKLTNVTDPVGLTIEGLQEWHDEACLIVLNNAFKDGISWHDSACHIRSPIVCEDSEELLARARRENPGVKIKDPVPKEQ